MSTREVYGPVYTSKDVRRTPKGLRPKFLVNETFALSPQTCYGKSKLIAELMSESHPFSNVIRLSTGYTDFDHPGGNWVLQMIKTAVHGKTVTLAGGGRQFRDPLHADDLGRLMELLLQKKIYGEKFNVGGGSKNLISLDEYIRSAVPKARLEKTPGGDFGFAFDNRKAHRLTGWAPRVPFREKLSIIAGNVSRNAGRSTPIFGPGA
jgi:nucleoside-diphosphate-sugar epimerase